MEKLRRGRPKKVVQETTPLSMRQWKFVSAYIEHGELTEAAKQIGMSTSWGEIQLNLPNVLAEIKRQKDKIMDDSIMSAKEVMQYFTKVVRGEIKDQFGLEAPLAERTKAAVELAKRTIDIDNRAKGVADNVTQIKIDWSRD